MRNYLPVSLVSKKSRRSSFPLAILRIRNVLIISKQGYEDAIENLKIQFAAVSEEKAEVERKLEPLIAESAELKKQADEFDNRKQQHAVSPSCGLFFYRVGMPTAVIVTD